MARLKMVVGNWKMNKNFLEGLVLVNEILGEMPTYKGVTVAFAPSFIHLHTIGAMLSDQKKWVKLAAQNLHQSPKGAFTGEISAEMLQSAGAEFVLVGHSERRQYFNETDELLAQKAKMAIQQGLSPIFCVGEPLEIREQNQELAHVKAQLERGLFGLDTPDFEKVVIAYEPVWAIGTGKTASPQQAQTMHAFIRQTIAQKYGQEIANQVTLLYGGSCNALNAQELFSQADVDGGLIGGASLKAAEFVHIVDACAKYTQA
jgi:triosephosphate isomerase